MQNVQKSILRLFTVAFLSIISAGYFYITASAQDRRSQPERGYDCLQRIAFSDTLSFSAITTFEETSGQRKDRLRRFEVVRYGADKGWWHTLEPEKDSNAIDILVNNVFYETYTDKDEIDAWPRRSRDSIINVENIALILNNYSVNFLPVEVLGNFTVDVVEIKPKQNDRSWKKVWVHRSNGFIFRMEQYNLDNKRDLQLNRENVIFNPLIDPQLFEVNYRGKIPMRRTRKKYDTMTDVQNALQIELIAPVLYPPGFVIKNIGVRYDDDEPVVQFYFTDGILSFSLFQRQTDRDDRGLKIDRHHGDLYISARKDNIYYRFDGDIDQISRNVIVQSFESIQVMKRHD